MSRLNKRALYQMATKNDNTSSQVSNQENANSGQLTISRPSAYPACQELTFEMVELKPLTGKTLSHLPDGRLTGSIVHPMNQDLQGGDAASVSARARRSPRSAQPAGVNRSTVLNRLGHSSLGYLTNAYLEQQTMTDEEIHMIQERFYGLQAI